MGQREDFELGATSAEQVSTPLAWRYMLGDGKWRYQWEWSHGAVMHPVYELTDEIRAALSR
jgi:hypothetical protein